MSKSRTFSLYLLKKGYNASNALKPENSLEDISEKCSALPQGTTLYVMDKPPTSIGRFGMNKKYFMKNFSLKGDIVYE